MTSNPTLANQVFLYRDFGKADPWVSYHYDKGWNYRVNEFGAAVLYLQLKHYEEILENRQGIERLYRRLLNEKQIEFLPKIKGGLFCGYKIIIFLKGVNKSKFIEACRDLGVKFAGNVYDWILPEQPVYWGQSEIEMPEIKNMLCLPCRYGMKKEEVKYVAEVIKKVLKDTRR